jgi:6-phosphofructokinase 1
VARTIELTHELRTTAGSHERFLVIEVFGRYAGYTALLPTMAGAADRCVIPEHPFHIDQLTELLSEDRRRNPSHYAVVLVSEGAQVTGDSEMSFAGAERDQYGHRKLGGIGDRVAEMLKENSTRFNAGRRVNVVSQRLGYLVRCGAPDALDAIVPMAFGNLALDLVLSGTSGRLVCLRNGVYDSTPIEAVVARKKVVNLARYYEADRLRPKYTSLVGKPWFVMTSD